MAENIATHDSKQLRMAYTLIGGLSVIVVVFLFWFIYFRQAPETASHLSFAFSTIAAAMNSLCAVFLVLGFRAIKRRDQKVHMRFMTSAGIASALFLVAYLCSYYLKGDTKFPGQGIVRPVYYFILISHIGLSIINFPMVLATFYLSFTKRFKQHRKLARYTFPIWLYVSVTGVMVYLFLQAYT